MDNQKKGALTSIAGKRKVLDDAETLAGYAQDESFAHPMKPWLVVKPKNVDEAQSIVQWANLTETPLVPVSSGGPHFHGDTVPSVPQAVMVDLSGMKRIIKIDRRNCLVLIEPGVTYTELQPALAKEGLRLSAPLLPRSNKSVIAALLERQPTIIPRYQWTMQEPLRGLEVVWGNGDKLYTGAGSIRGENDEQWKMGIVPASGPGPGQLDYYKLLSAAQGTMGIVTWASVKCEVLPEIHKLFFVPSDKLETLIDFTYKILRIRFGDELMLLNSSSLAAILGEDANQISVLQKKLVPWVVLLGVAGRTVLAKERVEFQTKDITEIAHQSGLQLVSAIPGAKEREVLQAVLNPSPEPYWKLRYKGGGQDIFFLTTLDKTPQFIKTMYSIAEAQRYATSDIGVYLQPVHQGASCHCEFNLPFDPGNKAEVSQMKALFGQTSEALLNQGAFFSRPYGPWANMVYNRDAQTTTVLKKVKAIFDPRNVLNPGKLCF
jgi:FAD/FMN-containing dehydrogenase